jgi:AcrR family transcriptional regulator
MVGVVKTRSYNSPTRRLQLSATKSAVLAAARERMAEHGYSATTMEQIAADAGVAVQTVYKHFGSKAAIVKACIEQARLDPRVAQQRQQLLAEVDPAQQVRQLAQRTRLYAEMGIDASQLMAARAEDPELAKAWRRLRADVGRSHLEYAQSLERKGALRKGVGVEEAADYISVVLAPDLFSMLRRNQDWSFDQAEQWLAGVLMRLLLD